VEEEDRKAKATEPPAVRAPATAHSTPGAQASATSPRRNGAAMYTPSPTATCRNKIVNYFVSNVVNCCVHMQNMCVCAGCRPLLCVLESTHVITYIHRLHKYIYTYKYCVYLKTQ
jgi:hypothetical protein